MGFLTRYDGELREPLVWRQGSQGFMSVAEAACHCPRVMVGESGIKRRPSPSAGDLRELPRVPLRGEESCGVGGASRDSAGSGATEEVLIWLGGTLMLGGIGGRRKRG